MNYPETAKYITSWLNDYADKAGVNGFVVGLSGGVDSAVVSTLCAMTGRLTEVVLMPIHQTEAENIRAREQADMLTGRFQNVRVLNVDLSNAYDVLAQTLATAGVVNDLGLVNTRSRLRMIALYGVATDMKSLVVGTGNKVEDMGIGFFTKYGDGGVDISPIGDLMKSEVYALAKEIGVVPSILAAKPTDGLWTDGRTDEDQIGATYDELEWAMQKMERDHGYASAAVTPRQEAVLKIYNQRHNANAHKMAPIPICAVRTAAP